MAKYEFGSDEFHQAMWEAGHQAFLETLAAGLPVTYVDDEDRTVVGYPDGRKFEIRWIPGAPAGQNYEILRELKNQAV